MLNKKDRAKIVLKGKLAKDVDCNYIESTTHIDGEGVIVLQLLATALIDVLCSKEGIEAGLTLTCIKKQLDEIYKYRRKEGKNNENNL